MRAAVEVVHLPVAGGLLAREDPLGALRVPFVVAEQLGAQQRSHALDPVGVVERPTTPDGGQVVGFLERELVAKPCGAPLDPLEGARAQFALDAVAEAFASDRQHRHARRHHRRSDVGVAVVAEAGSHGLAACSALGSRAEAVLVGAAFAPHGRLDREGILLQVEHGVERVEPGLLGDVDARVVRGSQAQHRVLRVRHVGWRGILVPLVPFALPGVGVAPQAAAAVLQELGRDGLHARDVLGFARRLVGRQHQAGGVGLVVGQHIQRGEGALHARMFVGQSRAQQGVGAQRRRAAVEAAAARLLHHAPGAIGHLVLQEPLQAAFDGRFDLALQHRVARHQDRRRGFAQEREAFDGEPRAPGDDPHLAQRSARDVDRRQGRAADEQGEGAAHAHDLHLEGLAWRGMLGDGRELLLLGSIPLAVDGEVAIGPVEDDVGAADLERRAAAIEGLERELELDAAVRNRQQLVRPQRIAGGGQPVLGAHPRRSLVADALHILAIDQHAFRQGRCLAARVRSGDEQARDEEAESRDEGGRRPHAT